MKIITQIFMNKNIFDLRHNTYILFILSLIFSLFADKVLGQTKVKTSTEVVSTTEQFKKIAYYNNGFNYNIHVFVTNASINEIRKHAKQQPWSKYETTMVCYFRNEKDINVNAFKSSKSIDDAINQIWKPCIVARYIHWPSGKEEFTKSPYTK